MNAFEISPFTKDSFNMENISWSDGLGSRSRSPFLLFIKGDEIIPFDGSDIPGVVVVRGTDYAKNGKWSHTTYRLQLADGIRHIAGSSPVIQCRTRIPCLG